LDEFSETWPRWGMMRDGECWELATLAHRTEGIESGLLERWPTPQSRDYKGSSGRSMKGTEIDLPTKVKMWPTPTAHNAKEGGFPSEHSRNTPTLSAQAGGTLNPTWTEWLMGWPLGWTDLKPLETDKFQQW
jgi:hypothetical protein